MERGSLGWRSIEKSSAALDLEQPVHRQAAQRLFNEAMQDLESVRSENMVRADSTNAPSLLETQQTLELGLLSDDSQSPIAIHSYSN